MNGILSKILSASSVAAATLTLTAVGMAPAEAGSFTRRVIDFDSDITHPAGTKIQGNEWSEWGVEVEAFKGNNKRHLTIFDTNCEGNVCSGGDDDLGTAYLGDEHRGNALIIQNGRNWLKDDNNDGVYDKGPNDNAGGGTIRFDFTNALLGLDRGFTIDNLEFIDYDKGESRNKLYLTAYDIDGNQIEYNGSNRFDIVDFGTKLYDPTGDGENSVWNFDFDQLSAGVLEDVAILDVNYNGISGAISKVEFQQYAETAEVPEPSAIAGLAFLGGGILFGKKGLSRKS